MNQHQITNIREQQLNNKHKMSFTTGDLMQKINSHYSPSRLSTNKQMYKIYKIESFSNYKDFQLQTGVQLILKLCYNNGNNYQTLILNRYTCGDYKQSTIRQSRWRTDAFIYSNMAARCADIYIYIYIYIGFK